MAHVMVLDDEPSICWAFRNFLSDDGHRVTVASSAEQILDGVASDPPDVLFLDVRLPGMDGLAALEQFRGLWPKTPVIVMTAYGTVQAAVGAVRGGAFDYLPKPFDLAQARALVDRALLCRTTSTPKKNPPGAGGSANGVLVGPSAPMQMVFKQVALAAACSEPVLITGESGTGKELVARAIHQHSDRAEAPFVAVHLVAMPESLVERELFGHERGAYTGAEQARPGLFDLAEDGTIFFDEVAEAPASIQAKLLRVLDGGDYRPVGGGTERRLHARVIAATNRDMSESIRSGSFRADLFYRLAVLSIHLPPLRDRREDILVLWEHFWSQIAPTRAGRLDPASPLARHLALHDWPGNVRELRNAVEQAARSSVGGPIPADFVPSTVRPATDPQGTDALDTAVASWARSRLATHEREESDLYEAFLGAVEPALLRTLLAWTGGNQARVARLLGLHRSTLRQKLRRYGLDASPQRDRR
jgi:two-component system nitrogen regulation response regulator GlnG